MYSEEEKKTAGVKFDNVEKRSSLKEDRSSQLL